MSKKHTYRTVEVQQVELARLRALLPAALVIVGLDVAKRNQVAAFCDPQGHNQLLVKFEHPAQTPLFMDLLSGLMQDQKTAQVAMEPTGTYGDILCHEADKRGAQVYWVSPKRTHDAAEVFDGVPRYHDAKDATLVARLHAQGVSRRWQPASEVRRELRALVARREIYAGQQEELHGALEGLLARHWPEADKVLNFREQKSALRMLVEYPDPRQVAQAGAHVQELLNKGSRGRICAESVKELLSAAARTQGVPLLAAEQELLRELAREMLRATDKLREVEDLIRSKLQEEPKRAQAAAFVGATTLAVLMGYMGELEQYSSAGALEKAMGLNLKESSSGENQRRGVHITKRGPGIVRKYLYLATLRWIKKDPVAAAWYQGRQRYGERAKGLALVALMRKLVRGIWHLSRGATYEAERLFDTRRLKLVERGQPKEQPELGQKEATM